MDYRERWELKDYLVGRVLHRRILVFHLGLALILIAFLVDFWYLQGVRSQEYASLAQNNLTRRIPLKPTRGEIYDRNREVLASTRPSLDLMLRREGKRKLEPQIREMAPVIGIPAEELLERLDSMRGRPLFEPLLLKGDVSLEELATIEARRERFSSVEVREAARRHYPEGGYMPHAIGYVGEVSDVQLDEAEDNHLRRGDIVGKAGVERIYDRSLRGDRGWHLVSVNNLGRQIGDARIGREPAHGAELTLTLDMKLQRTLVEELGQEVGAGVFLDPWTGEVLAMASTPTFDPNLFADGFSHKAWRAITEDPRRPLHDRVIASFYAPGSTFKVVLAVAGLETGTITPQETTYCNGSTTLYGRRRLCWKRGGHGKVNLRKALAGSCNVYFYHLGQRLGIETIHEYGKRFGLGRPTGIDATGEESGILPSHAWKMKVQREQWYPGDTISVAIGQGLLAVTPIQMARMISAVASGRLAVPHLEIVGNRATERLDVSEATLREIRVALADAVEVGTGREATRGDFSVAGKTGTAQVYKHSAGIDSNDLPKDERDHAWFVGYSPATEPRIAFAVIVEHGGHGGSTAAPIARKVLETFFRVERPEPDRTEDSVVRTPPAR